MRFLFSFFSHVQRHELAEARYAELFEHYVHLHTAASALASAVSPVSASALSVDDASAAARILAASCGSGWWCMVRKSSFFFHPSHVLQLPPRTHSHFAFRSSTLAATSNTVLATVPVDALNNLLVALKEATAVRTAIAAEQQQKTAVNPTSPRQAAAH